MDALRRRAAAAAGAVVAAAGSASWALAATSMSAVRAAEDRALGPGHTAEMPGAGELQLVAHDARLAAVIAVACGLAVAVAALPRRVAAAAWLGGIAALVVANATLGRAVDGGSVALSAAGLGIVTSATALVAGRWAARHRTGPATESSRLPLLGAGAAAAGTLPVLAFQGLTSERYAAWVPAGLGASNLVAALALAAVVAAAVVLLARDAVDVVLGLVLPVTALVVLLEPQGSSWQVGDAPWAPGAALLLAAAPLVLAAARERSRSRRRTAAAVVALLAPGVLLALVPQLLAFAVLLGGLFGLVVTAPAGAVVGYDGLPVVGGGLVLGAVVLAVCAALRIPAVLPRERAGVLTESR